MDVSYLAKQRWHTSLATFVDTQLASGSEEKSNFPLLIAVVARKPLPLPGLANRSNMGAITFGSPREHTYAYVGTLGASLRHRL